MQKSSGYSIVAYCLVMFFFLALFSYFLPYLQADTPLLNSHDIPPASVPAAGLRMIHLYTLFIFLYVPECITIIGDIRAKKNCLYPSPSLDHKI